MTDAAPATGVERLGTRPIGRLLLELSSQTTFSLVVYAVYAVTDTYFLSIGINANAAAGAAIISPVLIALGGIATIVGAGGASLVSRALGEGDIERASRTVANTFITFWTAAAVITVGGALFIEPIVHAFGASPQVAPYAVDYGRIIFLGALTSTGFSAIVRADGSARYSTAMWVIPVSTNIVLCWLFVMVLHVGARGAALATVAGQAVSAAMSMYFFLLRPGRPYRITRGDLRPDRRIIGGIVAIGSPSFLKSLSASSLVVVTNNLLKSNGGASAQAVYAVVYRIYTSFATPQTGIVQGMQPIIGYNLGRGLSERVRHTIRLSLRATIGYGLTAMVACLIAAGGLVRALTKDGHVAATGPGALRVLALAFPVGGIGVLVAGYFQASGSPRHALALMVGGVLLAKLPILLIATHELGLRGVWAAEAASELLVALAAIALLRRQHARSTTSAGAPLATI